MAEQIHPPSPREKALQFRLRIYDKLPTWMRCLFLTRFLVRWSGCKGLPWKSKPVLGHHLFKGWFRNHHGFSRGLSSSKWNHHFKSGGWFPGLVVTKQFLRVVRDPVVSIYVKCRSRGQFLMCVCVFFFFFG